MPLPSCMWLLLLAAFGAHGVLGEEWPWPAKFPNIGYISRGYNIYFGNPRATQVGVDPGFQSYPLYQLNYRGKTTGDHKYELPDGFEAIRNYGCALEFTSDAIYTSSYYSQLLTKDVITGFRIPFIARFQTSTDYRNFHSLTTTENKRMVTSTAECLVYDASVDSFAKPALSKDFNTAIRTLPREYGDGEAYFDLFDNFGTHSLQKAKMGSRYGFSAYFDEKSWTNVERLHVSVTHAASVFGFYHTTKTGNTTVEINTFKENMQAYQEISLGAKPVVRQGAEAWAEQVVKEPMPISYTLKTLCEAIDDVSKKGNCLNGLNDTEYCTKRLKKEGKIIGDCRSANDIDCLWDGDCKEGVCASFKCDTSPQSVAWRPNTKLCLTLGGGGQLTLNTCTGQTNQKWIFNSGEYENYMQIQYAADTNQCVDGGSMASGQPLRLVHCSGSPAQTWAREISMGSIYLPNGPGGTNVCIDAGSGVQAGKNLMVWGCNVLPQQQYDLVPHKSGETLVVV